VNSKSWQRVKELFEAASELGPGQRAAFLAQACFDDEEVRQEVESLLGAHERNSGFMNKPVGQLLVGDKPVLAVGQSFGHYEEISPLGEGGMGQVYLALDTRLGRKVALKLLPSACANEADHVQRLEQEARAASALNHPNIVTIHEIGEIDSVNFMATEFVDGRTLREHMTSGEMTVGEVLDVAAQVASALQAAHEAGIVHRDIKPENIMVRRDGVVKVLDFGLAKLNADQATSGSQQRTPSMVHTSSGVIMGTVGYMSPEQARGLEVDARTDIWSLGVVLYEMVAGHAPFSGDTRADVIVSIKEKGARPLAREIPAELERIIAKAMTKERTQRFQTTAQMALELKNLKEDLTLESRLKQLRNADGVSEKTYSGVALETARESVRSTSEFAAGYERSVKYGINRVKPHKAVAVTASLILLVSSMGVFYVLKNRNKSNSGPIARKSIAVLPLRPVDAANRDEAYEVAVAESLIYRISLMNGFAVRPLSATRRYGELARDPIDVGKEQQVDYVLTSTYQLAAGKIRITAQLLNVATGAIENTYQVEKDTADMFAMQDAIADELGNKLLTQFATTSKRLAKDRGTTNEQAYRLYLQGMYLANNRNLSDAEKSIQALEQTVQLDPTYARAWAGLGYAHRTVSVYTDRVSTHETYQKSIEAINRALALDENLSEAHSALCENKYLYEWDFAGAERECKRAIELNPDSGQAHEIFSRYLMGRGRHGEAIAEIKTAIDLEPASRFFQHIYGRALFYARRYSEAADQFKRVIAMDKNFLATYSYVASALALQGNESEALEWFMKLLALRNADEKTVQVFRIAFQASGWQGVLREYLKRLDTVGGNNFDGAVYNSQIRNKDAAFEYLEKLYEQREFSINYVQVDPRLDGLRDDPRFNEFVKRVEKK
jgi:serine/threonine protein kinase/tetratricopeptide (TPR) repeat protein